MPTRRRSKIETILFTDIEGSTRQGELTPAAMGVAVGHHNNILSEAIAVNQGEVLNPTTLGQGVALRASLGNLEWDSTRNNPILDFLNRRVARHPVGVWA